MPIKKYSYSKNNSKNSKKSKKMFKKHLNRTKTKKNKKHYKVCYSKSKSKSKSKRIQKHRGGFKSSCNLATVTEPGFNLSNLGSIAGISIPDTKAAIYRPNCKTDSYQAMVS